MKPRYELKNARLRAGLTEVQLADAIGSDAETVRRWETGMQNPQAYYIGKLCNFFNVKHVRELNLDAQFNASTQRREDEILEMLQPYDRRQLLVLLGQLPALAGIDLTVLFSTTSVAPEHFLSVCRAVIKICWNLLDQNGYDIADYLLSACMTELERLATQLSNHQQEAASLAVEAKVIQIKIATQKRNYARRAQIGSQVVDIGEMSGDRNLHATALGWHANTYVNCFSQPETSIAILKNALPCLNDNAPLNKADIYMELARVYALDEQETDEEAKKVRDYAEQAHIAMPENPELDPLYRLIDLGKAELNMREGKTYLILARRFPSQKEYGQKAHDIFTTGTHETFLTAENRGGTLIYQAEAARIIEDMHDYFTSLEEGVRIALQIGSEREITHAVTTIQKAPRGWRNEQRYKELQKLIRKIFTPQVNSAPQ